MVDTKGARPDEPVIAYDVVHLTSVHRADDVRIFRKEAVSGAKHGLRVAIVATGDGDRQDQDVSILCVRRPRSRLDRLTRTTLRVLHRAWRAKAALYHVHDPELLPAAILLRALGRRVIYDVHEDVPKDILDKHWLPRASRRSIARSMAVLEWIAGRVLSGIVAVTPSIAQRFPSDRTIIIANYPLLTELQEAPGETSPRRASQFAYVGGILEHRGLEQVVAALDLLGDAWPGRLAVAGTANRASLMNRLRSAPGWRKVDELGQLSRSEVRELLGTAIAGLVLFQPVANHIEALPTKMFEYMSAGLAVVASDFPLWRGIIKRENAGLTVDPNSPKAIAATLQWLGEHPDEAVQMGRNGRRAVEREFNWEAESMRLLAYYERLAALEPRSLRDQSPKASI